MNHRQCVESSIVSVVDEIVGLGLEFEKIGFLSII